MTAHRIVNLLAALAVLIASRGHGIGADLESDFRSPPAVFRPWTMWMWINGNVTKEGIKADLEAMKAAGLGGVVLFDVTWAPEGSLRSGSDAWHECLQYAIRTADELGLRIDLMICPGWAMCGGPWITPEQSMKELVWSQTEVGGGGKVKVRLPPPPSRKDFYRDVAVLAVPADAPPEGPEPEMSVSGDRKKPVITLTYPEPVERRLLEFDYGELSVGNLFAGTLEAAGADGAFRKVRDFRFSGGTEARPIVIPFPPVKARSFRIAMNERPAAAPWPISASEVRLSNRYRTENFQSKTLIRTVTSGYHGVMFGPLPEAALPAKDPDAIPLDRVVDLTGRMAPDGSLEWDAPPGRWDILRFGYTTTGTENRPAPPGGQGLEADKFDAAAIRYHFDHYLGRILREAGPLAGKTFATLHTDSWEVGPQNWTAAFPQEFRERRGYDLTPYLPALAGYVVGSGADSEAFLSDFRRTCSELMAEKYYGTLRELAHEHGMKLSGEPYLGRFFNEAEAAAQLDLKMTEFWVANNAYDRTRVKKMSSVVHTLGAADQAVAAETFTARPDSGRWQQVPSNLKPVGDAAFALGLNFVVLHTCAHQPRLDLWPGFSLGPFGSHFGRTNTWWPLARAWTDYLARCHVLLQQGRFVGDFLALRSSEVDVLVEETAPEMPAGSNFDFISPPQMLRTKAENGRVVLPNGSDYRAVILPKEWTADTALLEHLAELARAGVPVYGNPPNLPAGRRDLHENETGWKEAGKALWGPSGLARKPSTAQEIARDLKLEPDFAFTSTVRKAKIEFLHRAGEGLDIYFLSNQGQEPVTFTGSFRVAQKQPELWDAVTGAVLPAPVFREEKGRTALDLRLDVGGSVFVVFRQPPPARWMTSMKTPAGRPLHLESGVTLEGQGLLAGESGAYAVSFNDGKTEEASVEIPAPVLIVSPWKVEFRAPGREPFHRDFPALSSWTESADPAVRYFSGLATYRTEFELPAMAEGQHCLLDLGRVCDLAEVRVNGKPAGIWWTPPFSRDITGLLQPGKNTLEVTVANRWINRMIGDEQLPPETEYVTTGRLAKGRMMAFPTWYSDPQKAGERKRETFFIWKFYEKDSPLVDSGLIGPVTLNFRKPIAVK